jgi:hypothetical protein
MERRRLTYGRDESAEILDLAGRLDDSPPADEIGLSRNDLHRIARELDIDPSAVDAAIAQRAEAMTTSAKETKRAVRRRMRLIRHLVAYVVTVTALLLVDALGGGGWWFFYVGAVWGVVVVLHASRFLTRRNGPLERRMLEPR